MTIAEILPLFGAIGGLLTIIAGAWTGWRRLRTDERKIDSDAAVKRLEITTNADSALRDDLLARITQLEGRVDELQAQVSALHTERQGLFYQIGTLTTERDEARRQRDALLVKLGRAREELMQRNPDVPTDTLDAISDIIEERPEMSTMLLFDGQEQP